MAWLMPTLLALLLGPAAVAVAAPVEALGTAPVVRGNTSAARKKALADAFRQAVDLGLQQLGAMASPQAASLRTRAAPR